MQILKLQRKASQGGIFTDNKQFIHTSYAEIIALYGRVHADTRMVFAAHVGYSDRWQDDAFIRSIRGEWRPSGCKTCWLLAARRLRHAEGGIFCMRPAPSHTNSGQ
jgi:hypothetical protein